MHAYIYIYVCLIDHLLNLIAQPRDLRLLDEQFDAFLSAYDDDKIGKP
jgi:hypothetical protein